MHFQAAAGILREAENESGPPVGRWAAEVSVSKRQLAARSDPITSGFVWNRIIAFHCVIS
jgi:hypothetical protein